MRVRNRQCDALERKAARVSLAQFCARALMVSGLLGFVLFHWLGGIQNPAALQYFRPMLLENGGWSVFIYTPRGHNHGHTLYKTALKRQEQQSPEWFCQRVDIDESKREDGTPVVTREQYEDEIANGMPEATALQEFYCDFDQGMPGAYYADQISKLYKEEAIGHFPHDPSKYVLTAWDLGLNDNCSIWFFQVTPGGPRIIDYESEANVPLTEWVRVIKDKPYNYFEHIGPHDLNVREMSTAVKRIDTLRDLGLDFRIAPKLARSEGIEAVRRVLPTCQFHEQHCQDGIEALQAYERVYDTDLQNFKDTPKHNWASHGADSFRYLALMWDEYKDLGSNQPAHYVKTSAGTKHRKVGRSSLPPLLMGGHVRRNGMRI